MALLIGIDEAGYGPYLGPLVVAATVWEVPGDPKRFDPWTAFDGIVSDAPDATRQTVHIADSKVVHSSAAGIAAIERSATAILRLAQRCRESLFQLWDDLTESHRRRDCGEPWFCGDDLPLPLANHDEDAFEVVDRWSDCCTAKRCQLVAVGCEIVPARDFNAAVHAAESKGRVLSETTLRLLRRLWNPGEQRALVLCDKHGGRDYYADMLADAFPEHMPLRLAESRSLSRYRIAGSEVRFQVRSEEHLPVAAASLVAKYLREASMDALNRYWLARKPDLKPTRGYPSDALRFLREIEADATSLGLDKSVYWRCR